MAHLMTATRGLCSWRDRLADPDKQWRRGYSAFETAVSWELAAQRPSGLPEPIEEWFRQGEASNPMLVLAVAEHKVPLAGQGGDSQCDVWAIVRAGTELISLAVEGKAKERFDRFTLDQWLVAGDSPASALNRQTRWEHVRSHLPPSAGYGPVRFQLLHRCAAAVIEAKRVGVTRAACLVQSFAKSPENVTDFATFCRAVDPAWQTDQPAAGSVDEVALTVGWVNCVQAADADVAACA